MVTLSEKFSTALALRRMEHNRESHRFLTDGVTVE
jgi:hypothetical protein